MRQEFKDWVIEQHEQMPPECKQRFLWMLKLTPDHAEQIIVSSLMDAATAFTIETGLAVGGNSDVEDAEELLQVLQTHFSTELAAIK